MELLDQLARAMEGLDPVDQLSVLLCFQFSDRVSLSALYLLAGQRGHELIAAHAHELIAAHANVTMDSPDGQTTSLARKARYQAIAWW